MIKRFVLGIIAFNVSVVLAVLNYFLGDYSYWLVFSPFLLVLSIFVIKYYIKCAIEMFE